MRFDQHYIDGEWSPSTGQGTFEVVHASTEEVMATVPVAVRAVRVMGRS